MRTEVVYFEAAVLEYIVSSASLDARIYVPEEPTGARESQSFISAAEGSIGEMFVLYTLIPHKIGTHFRWELRNYKKGYNNKLSH